MYDVAGCGGCARLGRAGSRGSSVYIMGEGLSLGLFILFLLFSCPVRVAGQQEQGSEASNTDPCVPHSAKVRCSHL